MGHGHRVIIIILHLLVVVVAPNFLHSVLFFILLFLFYLHITKVPPPRAYVYRCCCRCYCCSCLRVRPKRSYNKIRIFCPVFFLLLLLFPCSKCVCFSVHVVVCFFFCCSFVYRSLISSLAYTRIRARACWQRR